MERRVLNFLFIAVMLAITFVIAFSNGELTNAWDVLFTLDLKWVLMAFVGWFGYMFFDALNLYYFLHKEKNPVTLRYICYVTLIGFYYSNITPGASGGQPMQVYYLSKHNVPVPIGTSAISIKFFSQQLMLVFMTSMFWLCNVSFVDVQLGGLKWAFYLGYAINFASIPLILLVALHRPMVQAIITFIVRMGVKLHLVKHPEDTLVRISAGLDVYHASILRLANRPSQIVGMLLLAGLSTLGMVSVPVSVYHAFRMSGTPWYQLVTTAFLLFTTASYTPLPGASGAQEGGFLTFYRGMFTQGTIGLALLVWRFFTYYLFLIIGAVISIFGSIHSRHRGAAMVQTADVPAETPAPAEDAPAAEGNGTSEVAPAAGGNDTLEEA
ncbi:MAG: flippase-like domain-containing protein [Eubacteriales bacterium]|nr:flippase-like domain-containing protein [Eubacteriales bacterium]